MFDLDAASNNDHHFNWYDGYYEVPLNNQNLKLRPTISYLYLDLDTTSYGFESSDFGQEEWCGYLRKMRKFSNMTLKQLVDYSEHNDHFRINERLSANEKTLLTERFPADLVDAAKPYLGHFALYNTKFNPEKPDKKCPRVFFLLGTNCVFHILSFDAYHKIHPMSETEKKSHGI